MTRFGLRTSKEKNRRQHPNKRRYDRARVRVRVAEEEGRKKVHDHMAKVQSLTQEKKTENRRCRELASVRVIFRA